VLRAEKQKGASKTEKEALNSFLRRTKIQVLIEFVKNNDSIEL
jgi:hypothetical protein